ncbi:AUGMIN subunit 6-like protein [Drosera capensis]
MTMDREKEREIELESAMYTNCLLLGLDPSTIGLPSNNSSGNVAASPPVGLFRHSNPKLGEQLLYFILSSLRGPAQCAKDFDKVWPIFDSAQSRDFRKVVQGIISELESQGALPRSNSRVSSLATCCGPRFVELLWQLSLHALREVHQRTFPADVSSNPLPASLTDVAFSHAAALIPVTKARIALERRKFLKNAEAAVQRQAMWSNLAHEMTAEFRGLCAEEAYLQQELEKLQDLRNKAKSEVDMWDDRGSGSGQSSHLVSKATRLWESLLSRKSEHEILASGPIEDLIAHREHRYRISGSALLAAMDQSSKTLSSHLGDQSSVPLDGKDQLDGSETNAKRESRNCRLDSSFSQASDETLGRSDDRSGRGQPSVDIAEILRRWTHALQRIHKQSLKLAKANDGEGPELLRSGQDGGTSGHAESLAATLDEHRQHLASIQVLINQLKEVAPSIQKSIAELTDEVNSISTSLPPFNRRIGRSSSVLQAQNGGRTVDGSSDDIAEITSKLSNVQLEKTTTNTLKLPPLFSLTPNSSGKSGNMQKRSTSSPQTISTVSISDQNSLENPSVNNTVNSSPQADGNISYIQNMKRSVREAALSVESSNFESSRESHSEDGSEHFFTPVSPAGFISRNKRFLAHEVDSSLSTSRSECAPFVSQTSFYGMEEAPDEVFSPPLLVDSCSITDAYEDLLVTYPSNIQVSKVWVISLGVNDQPPSKKCRGGIAYKVDTTRQFAAIMGFDVIRFTGFRMC